MRRCPLYGITIPFDRTPLAEHREIIEELVELGYTDVWSAEASGTDGFVPLAMAAAWAPSLRVRHRHRPVVHARPGDARDVRGDAGRGGTGPLRVRAGNLVRRDRGALERAGLLRALQEKP